MRIDFVGGRSGGGDGCRQALSRDKVLSHMCARAVRFAGDKCDVAPYPMRSKEAATSPAREMASLCGWRDLCGIGCVLKTGHVRSFQRQSIVEFIDEHCRRRRCCSLLLLLLLLLLLPPLLLLLAAPRSAGSMHDPTHPPSHRARGSDSGESSRSSCRVLPSTQLHLNQKSVQ